MEEDISTFEDLGLSDELLKAVGEAGYTVPTPIQEQAIPHVLMGRDLMGCAQTGTGKTASYALPMIDILASGVAKARMPRALVLAPTRELAHQIANNFEIYGKHSGLRYTILIGGEPFPEQERSLSQNPDVLIATPGRLIDVFERGTVMLTNVKTFVIDEADRMLDMGFIPDVKRIVSFLPRIRQTLLFSATLDREIRALADAFLINPKEVSVAPPATVAQTVRHTMVSAEPRQKREVLRKLLRDEDVQSALIFCNRKRDISVLTSSLCRHGFNAVAMHGDLPQYQRTETLAAFRRGDMNLLVCSDVAGRGLDIESVSHVFNFDVPINAEDYVHRIGRTGRAGKAGRAITLVAADDAKLVGAIVRLIGVNVPVVSLEGKAPDGAEPAGEQPKDDARRGRRGGEKRRGESQARDKTNNRRKSTGPAERTDSGRRHTPRRAEKSEGKEEETVVGLGNHVPDFLRVPTYPRGGSGAE